MSASIIETPSLHLELLSTDTLEALLAGDLSRASTAQGFTLTEEFLASVNDVFLRRHVDGARRHPSTPGWYVRAIRRREDGHVVGHCGFHGVPEDVGRAEIGYQVFAPYRRRGYATEAAQGLVRWAWTQDVDVVYATVALDNQSSIDVLTRVGFRRSTVAAELDDGVEHLYEIAR